jgi:E3 ubiquitin-protein ligase MARCH6
VSFAAESADVDQQIDLLSAYQEVAAGSDSEGMVMLTPDSSDIDNGLRAAEPSHTAEALDALLAPTQEVQDTAPNAVEEPSLLGRVAGWLWHVEDGDAVQPADRIRDNLHEGQDEDQHLVQDVFAEAPFVPNRHREVVQPAVAVEAPPAERREPNLVLGVDLNDPNAADDAEDLDGVLELLGMEGPIFGMIQNVIFSLFLITVTLIVSIWSPYMSGKVALLFLHKPIILIKAPLLLMSTAADLVVDMLFFVAGLFGYILNQPLKLTRIILTPLIPTLSNILDASSVEGFTLDLTQKSGARLEKTMSGAVLNLLPDMPMISMLSHHALRSLQAQFNDGVQGVISTVVQLRDFVASQPLTFHNILLHLQNGVRSLPVLPAMVGNLLHQCLEEIRALPKLLSTAPSQGGLSLDEALVEWSAQDRIITIILGYAFFATAGIAFLEIAHVILGLKENEKVEGSLADYLRQAGGVMKVIVIIGIEMLVFPLYCGLLLDVALMPLFANATLAGRVAFMMRTPFTGIFIHWFIGTCYMFHFALFVSICRKIMRPGVLYFIRDPDDPTFHPVRDVLERPVPAQLGKIAFSALVYGGLVIVCLGGVVWSLTWFDGVLPIQWATSEPRFAFPVDILFYNFMLPFVLRKAEPSKKVSAMYRWWFRGCARALRLTNFLFGEERPDERGSAPLRLLRLLTGQDVPAGGHNDGTYVRAPASDSVRIPKGRNVFLEVTEQNERVDSQPDSDFDNHGRQDPRFTKVYLPPNFRARIATFIFLLWVFAASTGVAFAIGPLVVGRRTTQLLSQSSLPPNDLYAFTIGIHIFAALGYAFAYARPALDYLRVKIPRWFGRQLAASTKYVLGLVYLGTFTLVVLPFVLSLIVELYVHVPLFTYLELGREIAPETTARARPVATIFILQSWTLGLLYLRLFSRLFLHHVAPNAQVVTAISTITRDGLLHPDVRLASRAFVLPVTAICLAALALPPMYAKLAIFLLRIHDGQKQMRLYRLAYPAVLGLVAVWLCAMAVYRQLEGWRLKMRDEVYLIGERLHNFHEPASVTVGRRKEKGKEKEV